MFVTIKNNGKIKLAEDLTTAISTRNVHEDDFEDTGLKNGSVVKKIVLVGNTKIFLKGKIYIKGGVPQVIITSGHPDKIGEVEFWDSEWVPA